jgi:L-threonylcarbamoyladenylate synthase
MAGVGQDIKQAADLLRNENLVAIPTETVYGLAGNAFSEKAIRKIFEVKNRPLTDPLIVHVANIEAITALVLEIPDLAKKLFEAFSPGPITILLPRSSKISDLVTNSSPFVAIRIPNHPLTLQLLVSIDFPLVAPSANPFGGLSPSTSEHVQKGIGAKIPYILEGGPCLVGLESTIVQIENENEIRILRQGGIPEEDLLLFAVLSLSDTTTKQVVPGSMLSHYAPNKQLLLEPLTDVLTKYEPNKIGFLGFDHFSTLLPKNQQVILSETGKLDEAARNLFQGLHHLDALPIEVIVVANIPEIGLGKAIKDRLKRAAAKRK